MSCLGYGISTHENCRLRPAPGSQSLADAIETNGNINDDRHSHGPVDVLAL